MMKSLILILIFLLLCVMGYAQKIHFIDTSNVWTMPSVHGTIVYHYSGMTTLTLPHKPAQQYHIIKADVSPGTLTADLFPCYVREDTIAKKVYVVVTPYYTHSPDTVEKLLYDYNLTVASGAVVYNDAGHEMYVINVLGIDSTEINGEWHKVWHIHSAYLGGTPTTDYYIIEGIGCTRGILNPLNPVIFGYDFAHLGCFENQGTSPFVSSSVPYSDTASPDGISCCFDNASSCTLKSPSISPLGEEISMYPNPVYDKLIIKASNGLDEGVISIYDMFGQQVYNGTLNKKAIINTAILRPGVYVVQLTDMNGNRMNKTVVKE